MHSKSFGDALFDYKLYQEIFVTSVGVLKLNGQFRKKSLKKCFSWKFIVSSVQVYSFTSFKSIHC